MWSLKDFVAAATHEHSVSADTLRLLHTGDFVRISVKQHADVASINIVVTKRVDAHEVDVVGSHVRPVSKTTTDSKSIDAAADYEATVKEQYQEGEPALFNTAVYVDNVDITITLKRVRLADGTDSVIGQDPTVPGALWWDDVLTGVGWVLGGLAVVLSIYVLYRVYRKYRHGEALFPRLDALRAKMGGGE